MLWFWEDYALVIHLLLINIYSLPIANHSATNVGETGDGSNILNKINNYSKLQSFIDKFLSDLAYPVITENKLKQ